MLPRLLSVLPHNPPMSDDGGFYTDGRGVDGEAPPDYSQVLDHPIGRTQRLIFDRYHAPADAELHNEADRLAAQLGAGAIWVASVVRTAKKVNRGGPMLKVLVGAYVEGGYPTVDIVNAAHALGMADLTGFDLFRFANHNRPLLKIPPRRVAGLYPLARMPCAVAALHALGPRAYDKFNSLYIRLTNQLVLEHIGWSPKTVARMALKRAADEFGVPVDAEEAF